MIYKLKSGFLIYAGAALLALSGCKKGTFDINKDNPNVPSSVDPTLILTAALNNSASNYAGGNTDFANYYMGYWAVSGDYIPNAGTVQYKINTDFFSGNWDGVYPVLKNYQSIIDYYNGNANGGYFTAIAKIMKAFHYGRMVDIYNNIPYTEALNGGSNNFPKYDDAKTIYKSLVDDLDAAVALINGATASTTSPGNYDILYKGNMTKWKKLANTIKLRLLVHLSETSDGPAYIQSKLTGMSSADFLGASEDAGINPGYSNSANNQQTPLWQDLGSSTTGTKYGNNTYYRACSYGVNFYINNNDPRVGYFYTATSGGTYKGRAFGSTALEHNSDISGIGGPSGGVTASTSGSLKSPSDPAIIFPASESFFLQAEAVQRGYMSGDAAALYQSGVTESFKLLNVPSATSAATNYTAQSNDKTNFTLAADKIKIIITQKWAAMNTYDPLEAWNDWRRLGIPADLPVSIYPGTTAPHIPYRLLYPTSEYSYNANNVNGQGTIDAITSKIFWMK